MNNWLVVSLLLSIFGFLKEIRPSEPFVYEFLIDKTWRNVTDVEIIEKVYPVATYSYLAHLVVIFLITDLCRYKPLIILLGASGVVIWALLLWTKSIFELQVVEVLYGTFSGAEVAYYTYIYAKVDTEYYQQVTSHTRAAILAGRTLSGISAQLLVSFNLMDYRQLNYITFSAMIAATVWSLFLPPVKKSIYFHRADAAAAHKPPLSTLKTAFSLMSSHLRRSFADPYVLKWSLWYALATCGFVQAQTYMQPLWTAIVGDASAPIYNGAVEAVLTLFGFLGALLAGALRADWRVKGDLALAVCSLLQGFGLLIASRAERVLTGYVAYVAFGALYHFMVTVASGEVAGHVRDDAFGLVFGANAFAALLAQTALTALVVTEGAGFALAPRDQYFVYGCFHVVIAVVFIVIGVVVWLKRSKEYRKTSIVGLS